MSLIIQGPRTGSFLLSEGNGQRSREQIRLAPTTETLEPGQILSKDENDHYAPFEAPAEGETVEVALLWEKRHPSTEPQEAVGIVREAEVVAECLIGLEAEATVALNAQGILLRA